MSILVRTAAAFALLFAMTVSSDAQEQVSLTISIKDHRFQPSELRAPAGKSILLIVKNLDSTPEEFESKSLRVERVIQGNSEGRLQLRALRPGRYNFFGDFHEATAQGVLVVE